MRRTGLGSALQQGAGTNRSGPVRLDVELAAAVIDDCELAYERLTNAGVAAGDREVPRPPVNTLGSLYLLQHLS